MEKFILEQMALELISKIKEINASLKELETSIANYKTSKISYPSKLELNKKIRSIVDKLKSIIILSESKFILPNKVIDNILVFFIKFLDILFSNKNLTYDKNIIANDILPSLVNFLKIEQNYHGMSLSQFITSKWKFLENILKYSLAFIDIFENNIESNLESSQIISVFDLVELIYFNLDSMEYKYNIMPGLISKILKTFTVIKPDLKISSKILKMFVKFFNENMNVFFFNLEKFFLLRNNKLEILNVESSEVMHLKNFHTFFEFFDLFHSKLQERISKDKLMKILPQLVQLNLNSLQNFVNIHKNNFSKLKLDSESIGKIFRNNFTFLTKLIQLENISTSKQPENFINKEFFSIFSSLYGEEEILQKLNQDISKVSRMILREELNVSLESIRALFINLQIYFVKKLLDNENFEEIFSKNNFTFNSILNNSNENESLKYLITKLFDDVYQKLFLVKSNPILEVVNAYEVQVNNITLEKSFGKFSNYLDQCLKFGQENEYKIMIKILKYTLDLYPMIRQHILNLILIKINTSTRKLKKILTNEDSTLDITTNETKKINIKEFISIFDSVLQELSLLLTICFMEKSEGQDFPQKQKILLKNLLNFYAGVLIEYGDELKCISKTKLPLMNSLIMMMYAYLIPSGLPSDKLFTQQELNNVLIFALPNYCNRTGILKYSATFLMSCMINNKNNRDLSASDAEIICELNLKNFIYSNFHFVINTTIKKIIYFDYTRSKNYSNKNTSQISFLSNFKLDVLNLFNSLLLLLEEFKEDNLINFYCGELNKLTAKLFSFLDMFTKEKNFFALECLLEIIERITLLQKKVIEKNHALFKINHYEDYIVSEVDQDGSQFVSFLKEKIGIDDSNLFRNIVLRILPLFLSNKISIQYKCLKIFENLISTLFLLPMSREEKKNFSTEDNSNVIVKSSLGPVMFEAWPYFIFLLGNKNYGDVKNILNKNLNFLGNIFNFFLVGAEYYPRFFNENRVFGELLKKIQENFDSINKSFTSIQILKAFSPVFIFVDRILDLNFSHNGLSNDSKENLINFLTTFSELILELKSSKKDIKFQRENMVTILPEINETVNGIISKINKCGIINSVNTQNKLDKLKNILDN